MSVWTHNTQHRSHSHSGQHLLRSSLRSSAGFVPSSLLLFCRRFFCAQGPPAPPCDLIAPRRLVHLHQTAQWNSALTFFSPVFAVNRQKYALSVARHSQGSGRDSRQPGNHNFPHCSVRTQLSPSTDSQTVIQSFMTMVRFFVKTQRWMDAQWVQEWRL